MKEVEINNGQQERAWRGLEAAGNLASAAIIGKSAAEHRVAALCHERDGLKAELARKNAEIERLRTALEAMTVEYPQTPKVGWVEDVHRFAGRIRSMARVALGQPSDSKAAPSPASPAK